MIIYNLFPLLAGPFKDWKPHLERAARLGFDWVFVNPIQYPGYSGSLYSIKDYFGFHPLLVHESAKSSPKQQLKQAAKTAASLKLKLMTDLVIGHCAFDSDLIEEHPGWFVWEKGKVAHPYCVEASGNKVVWKDLAKFNLKNSKDADGLFEFFVAVTEHLIGLGFQGFRCDAAYQVPAAWWRRLIRRVRKKHPGTVFLAETLGCTPHQTRETATAGFDAIFNSSKYWDFHGAWLMEQYILTREFTRSVSFPESHDTPRLGDELHGNVHGLKQRYLFSAFFSAGLMMPVGFEFGFKRRLHVVESRPEQWEKTPIDLCDFITAVNRTKTAHPLLCQEAPTEILESGNPNILFMWKGSVEAGEEALLILNKDIHNKQFFQSDNLYDFVQSKQPLKDVSPEWPLDFLPTPFEYDLRPGQGILLITGE